MTNLNRREFLKTTSLAVGSLLLIPQCSIKSLPVYRFFTNEEGKCIIALCEQIIPRDESPGATDAGVIFYIDRQLSGVFHYYQDTYRTGITQLQEYCHSKYSKKFEDLDGKVQIGLMKAMESNKIGKDEWPPEGQASKFFNLVLNHTMQGFYGSPIHGGNKDYVSFRMLKIDYPLVVGQNRYRS